MPNCPNCGNALPDGVSSCEKCGAPLAANIPPHIGADHSAQAEKKLFARRVWILVAVIAFLCLCPIPVAILYPVFASARVAAGTAIENRDMKQFALGVNSYTADHDGKFPDFRGGRVSAQLAGYLQSPELRTRADTYVWNTALQGHTIAQIQNRDKVWLAHSSGTTNGGPYVVGFLDGHVKRVGTDTYQSMLSQPIDFAKPQ